MGSVDGYARRKWSSNIKFNLLLLHNVILEVIIKRSFS